MCSLLLEIYRALLQESVILFELWWIYFRCLTTACTLKWLLGSALEFTLSELQDHRTELFFETFTLSSDSQTWGTIFILKIRVPGDSCILFQILYLLGYSMPVDSHAEWDILLSNKEIHLPHLKHESVLCKWSFHIHIKHYEKHLMILVTKVPSRATPLLLCVSSASPLSSYLFLFHFSQALMNYSTLFACEVGFWVFTNDRKWVMLVFLCHLICTFPLKKNPTLW